MAFQQFNQQVESKDGDTPTLNSELSLRHWYMRKDRQIRYCNTSYHTLSFYLRGGNDNRREDMPAQKGVTGSFCFMPQSQDSEWHIRQPVEFAHIYFSQTTLSRFAAITYQMDTRNIALKDQLFRDDAPLKNLFLRCFLAHKATTAAPDIYAEEHRNTLLDYVLTQFNESSIRDKQVKGGLSKVHREQVYQHIRDRLGERLSIAELAQSVHLSPFHFAKMFRLSFGDSPASFIHWLRINQVKRLLSSPIPLSEISLQTGFSHQSHMTQSFKALVGVTPKQYRMSL